MAKMAERIGAAAAARMLDDPDVRRILRNVADITRNADKIVADVQRIVAEARAAGEVPIKGNLDVRVKLGDKPQHMKPPRLLPGVDK